MRIPSGIVDQVMYFIAVDATDLKTRETGLTAFTVYRSRDGGASTVMTTPTITEVDAINMPGVYKLLLDEDMTIAAGNDSEEMIFHITQADMAPVDRTIELYRRTVTSGNTLGVTSGGDVSGKTGFSLAATGLDAIASTATGMIEIAKATWDRPLTGATHNIASSAGRRLRTLQDFGVYEGGHVWIDTINGTPGTVDFENGTVNNPVSNIADALIIRASVQLPGFRLLPGSSITLPSSVAGFEFDGFSYTIALGGQSVDGTLFQNAIVDGNDSGANIVATQYIGCSMGSNTIGQHHLHGCGLRGDIVHQEPGDSIMDQCYSEVAGSGTPSIDFQLAAEVKTLSNRHYSGGMEYRNANAGGGTHTITHEGQGKLIVAASSSGTIFLRGHFSVTNTGGMTLDYDDLNTNANLVKYQAQTVFIDTEQIAAGDGSARTPFNTIGGGLDFAELNKIRQIVFLADATLDRNVKNFKIDGLGLSAIDLNGQDVSGTSFEQVILKGVSNSPNFWSLIVGGFEHGLSGVLGGHVDINITGEVTLAANNASLFTNLAPAHVPGLPAPALIMPTGALHRSILDNFSGDLVLKGFDSALHDMRIAMTGGTVTIDASCIDGVIKVSGNGKVINNSAGTVVDTTGLAKEQVWDEVL